MKKTLAIFTYDVFYAEELARKINNSEGSIFHAVVFSTEESYRDYEKNNHIDVILCDDNQTDCQKEFQTDYVCRLTEFSHVADNFDSEKIYKYQSSTAILQAIIKGYSREKRKKAGNTDTGETLISCVCTPVGGSFASTMALALGQFFSSFQRTLFISLDPFFTLPGEKKDAADSNFTDAIYYLEQEENDIYEHLRKKIGRVGNLYYISGVAHWFDLYDFAPEHMHRLLTALCSSGDYDRIVFDVGIIGAASMEPLLAAEKIYTPLGQGKNVEKKVAEWRRQIEFSGQLDILEKTREIRIPFDSCLEGDYSYEQLGRSKVLGFIEHMESKGGSGMLNGGKEYRSEGIR